MREEYVDLQKGGEVARSVYGWDTDEPWGNRYMVREISLEPLPDGLYLIQGVQDRAEAQALLQVSSLSMQVKQTRRNLVVRVISALLDRETTRIQRRQSIPFGTSCLMVGTRD